MSRTTLLLRHDGDVAVARSGGGASLNRSPNRCISARADTLTCACTALQAISDPESASNRKILVPLAASVNPKWNMCGILPDMYNEYTHSE